MTELHRTRTELTIALLGVLFALLPVVDRIGDTGFTILNFRMRLIYAYTTFALLLALAVYLFMLNVIRARSSGLIDVVARYSLAAALALPIVYVALMLVAALIGLINELGVSRDILEGLVSALLGGITALLVPILTQWLSRTLARQEQSARSIDLAASGVEELAQAQRGLTLGLPQVAVLSAWNALEKRLRLLLAAKGVEQQGTLGDLIRAATLGEVISQQDAALINDARLLRNRAVHVGEPIRQEEAAWIVNAITGLLSRLRGPRSVTLPG
jgi:hypothetical protein